MCSSGYKPDSIKERTIMKDMNNKKQYVPLSLEISRFENSDILMFGSNDAFTNGWDDLQTPFG